MQRLCQDTGVQTDPVHLTRYWDLPREVVIEVALRRRIPGASRPGVTKTELVNCLLKQDLGTQF